MIFDVAIEYGHCRLSGGRETYEDPRFLALSAHYARRLRDTLAMAGYTSTIQVLVDDKNVSPEGDTSASLKALRADTTRELAPDFMLLESSLVGLLSSFVEEVLDGPKSARIARAIERYRDNHRGMLACSHDIALWHSLRLGRLSPSDLAPPADTLETPLAGRLHPAKLAVSILQSRDHGHEEAADREVLSRAPSIDPEHQLLRFYVPETESETDQDDPDDARWESFCRSVLDTLKLTEVR